MTELDERADALQDGASQFEKQAGKLKNKFWLQNIKFIVAGAIVGLILLVLLYFKFSDDPHPQYYNSNVQQPPPFNHIGATAGEVQNPLRFKKSFGGGASKRPHHRPHSVSADTFATTAATSSNESAHNGITGTGTAGGASTALKLDASALKKYPHLISQRGPSR